MKFGEIYLCKMHPIVGAEIGKYRPVVIINSRTNEIDPNLVTICPITTRSKRNDLELELSVATLERKSTVLAWYIRTLSVSRLMDKISVLSAVDNKKLKKLLKSMF